MPGDHRSERSLVARGTAYVSWRRRHLTQAADRLLVADLHRDPARCLYLASWQRSGSTWLAEMVASYPGTRLIYEPANIRQKLYFQGEPRLVALPFAGPSDELGDDGVILERAISGSLHSVWAGQLNATRRPQRRVVKDVRTVSILPWIAGRYPDIPVVLLLRHPLAVAHSLIELGWALPEEPPREVGERQGELDRDPRLLASSLITEVARWASHHRWAMTHDEAQRVHVIFYEQLVTNPNEEIERLATFLARHHESWHAWRPDATAVGRPSASSFRQQRGTTPNDPATWRATYGVPAIDEAMRMLREAGLGGLYDDELAPLVEGDRAIATVRSDTGGSVTANGQL